jgi:hypothetical protein
MHAQDVLPMRQEKGAARLLQIGRSAGQAKPMQGLLQGTGAGDVRTIPQGAGCQAAARG